MRGRRDSNSNRDSWAQSLAGSRSKVLIYNSGCKDSKRCLFSSQCEGLEKDELEDTLVLKTMPSDHFRTDCTGSAQVCPALRYARQSTNFSNPCLVMSSMLLISLSFM